ncbi:MAG: Mur ligase family protein [Candidatus Pacebacteria bacterium]|nr:Mur ligase family protein [Candidatus Paceibacterota bacterium]MDD3918974.1 Mur ligase family protein [Candidatus Paceibacterota bacterium]
MKLKDLKDKKIIIVGFGREGKNTYKTLKKLFPLKGIALADKNLILADEKEIYSGENYLENIDKYDVIIKTPGIPYGQIKEKSGKAKITSQTELFLENCPGKIIGITGTKGKSTTTTLIYKILKDHFKNIKLVGNMGRPCLSYLLTAKPKDIFVFEMSCHQLDHISKSPNISVFINIYPEHLDYYRTFSKYFNAKKNISKFQNKNDFFVYNPKFEEIKNIKTKAHKIPFEEQSFFKKNIHEDSIAAAVVVSKIFGLTEKEIKKSIDNFKTLDSRIEFVGTFSGINFYNDSLATIPEATIFALNELKNIDTLILGGLDRGIQFTKLTDEIKKREINNIILFPNSDRKIYKEIKNEKINFFFTSKMKDAVQFAIKNTKRGGTCLLSPAAPSYNLFKNYKDKANQFKKYLKNESKK